MKHASHGSSSARGDIPHTRWSLVARANAGSEHAASKALDELLRMYCPVLKKHLVRDMNFTRHRAEDLVQEFVARKILANNALANADAARGRFRAFLLKSFTNFAVSEIRKDRAHKRAPHNDQELSLDDSPDLAVSDEPFHHALDLEWARQILAMAVERMRKECKAKNRGDLWEVFTCRVLDPTLRQAPVPSYEQLVQRFGFESPSQASNLLITAKRMFRRALTDTVRDTVADDSQVEAEIQELKAILSG